MGDANMSAQVAVIMGSDSDYPVMKMAAEALRKFGVSYEVAVISAHRTPHEVAQFAVGARIRGVRVIIAGAGGAAHLPGMVAAYTELPVIGVPVPSTTLQGQDSLLSIVQMPKGVPVATVAIGNAWNAGVLAVQILGCSDTGDGSLLLDKIQTYKDEMRKEVMTQAKKLK